MKNQRPITSVHDMLNAMLSTQAVCLFKFYQRHFYVKGTDFFTLHKKFETLYEQASEAFDETAERLLALGGHPYSTMQEFLEHSILEENPYTEDIDAEKMVTDTIADMRTIRAALDRGIKLCDEKEDLLTQDMLIKFALRFDKHIWMFQAFLNKEAVE